MNEPEELGTEDRGTLGLKPKGGRGKTRVLLVDDDRKFTAVLEQGLENTGNYDVHGENWVGDTALIAREFKPHIVVIELFMCVSVIIAEFAEDG